MPKLNPHKRIAHGLQKIAHGYRLVKEGEKDVRAGLKAIKGTQKPRTEAEAAVGVVHCTDGLGREFTVPM